jgi:glycerate dehydrogenase
LPTPAPCWSTSSGSRGTSWLRPPSLKLIALAATGTNNVDLDAARDRGIAVCNVRDYCTASVVQHVLGTLLLLTHRLREYDALVRSGAWSKGEQFCLLDYPIRELAGRRFGIVGYGTLGQAVARAAQAFGMEIVIANRPGGEPQPGGSPWNSCCRPWTF